MLPQDEGRLFTEGYVRKAVYQFYLLYALRPPVLFCTCHKCPIFYLIAEVLTTKQCNFSRFSALHSTGHSVTALTWSIMRLPCRCPGYSYHPTSRWYHSHWWSCWGRCVRGKWKWVGCSSHRYRDSAKFQTWGACNETTTGVWYD